MVAMGILVLLFAVMSTVDFDDQTSCHAHEISDVWAKGFLALELDPGKAMALQ